jgi:hypothetical protein
VYAMSALCTAAVVWIMLKWEAHADEADSDKWLILIAYVLGLSIGVHLLNLLTLPALGFIYYYRRNQNPTLKGALLVLVVSFAIVGIILVGIIPGLPSLAGGFEVLFVNSIGLPFNSGLIIFLVLFGAAIWFGFRLSYRMNSRLLNTAMLSLVFVLIGYSSYLIVPIRSSFHPTINENNPEDVLSFVSYLKREQYGSRPLLYGPQFNAQPTGQEVGSKRYARDPKANNYRELSPTPEYTYDDQDKMLLPRLYSYEPSHIQEYKKWVDIQEGVKPTMGQNLSFLFRYQMGHMFWRYFMWNYVGRESDIQQAGVVTPVSNTKNLPARIAESPSYNNFFAIPLILGLIGLWFQSKRDSRDAFVVGLLFLLTGLAIIIYLNQPPREPRERDYTFTGATFAFAIWIGLGVLGIADLLGKVVKSDGLRAAVGVLLGLLAPGLLVAQGWDDHDRSDRYNSVDSAKNLLNSCAPNAILFTNGDNDTFPLWYAQEVEGVRTDVRVAVLSYLNTDWYIQQMKRRAYLSQPLPISMGDANYIQGTNDYLPYVPNAQVQNVDLKQFIGLVKENSMLLQAQSQDGSSMMSFPTANFYLPIDTTAVKALGIIPKDRAGQLVPRMEWSMGKRAIEKKNLVILDMIATNNWKRPIYFSSTVAPQDYMNLQPYFQLEGMAYRLLPLKDPNYDPRGSDEGYVDKDLLYKRLMQDFSYRGLADASIFYDENNLRFPSNYRDKFARLAQSYLDEGNTAKAKEVADKCLAVMPDKAIPYDYYSPLLVPALVAGGEKQKANELMDTMTKRSEQMLAYYATRPDAGLFDDDQRVWLLGLQSVYRAAEMAGDKPRSERAVKLMQQYYPQQ